MSKTTIFGEESFIDKSMISIIEERGKAIDNFICDEIERIAKYELPMPKIIINKDKVKKWLILCSQLENIEHSELIDIATKKKITDLEAKLAESKKKLRVSNSSVASSQLEYNKLKKEYDEQEKLLSQILASNSKLQFENDQLKQQLAEKDKEIETMKKDSDKNIDYLVEFASLIENEKDCNRMLKALERVKRGNKYLIDKDHNQDKIELLEKVRDKIFANYFEASGKGVVCRYYNIYHIFDEAIKELEGKNNNE